MFARTSAASALALYAAVAFLLLGLPLLVDGAGAVAGSNAPDSRLFTWAMGWWPHAIADGLDPLTTDQLYAPVGYDLLWTTSVPGPALALWPVTAIFGPVVAYDVAMVLAPALGAWTAFLLCREITGRVAPSLLGGAVFGFSSSMLATFAGGHLHVAWAFLLPLAALLGVRHARARMSTRAYVVLMALLLIAQFSISTEVLLTLVLFGGGLLVAAWFALPARRERLRTTVLATIAAGAVAGVVLSPLLWHLLSSPDRPGVLVELYVIDLLNPLFPTELTAIGKASFAELSQHYAGNAYSRGGYLGIGLLAILVAWAASTWRAGTREARLLTVFLAVALVLALGPGLRVAGFQTVLLPWWPMQRLPLFEYVLTYRFMAYVTLAAGVALALWLARDGSRTGRRWRWALAGLALALLVPAVGSALYRHTETLPELFTSGADEAVLRDGDRVFALPMGPYGPSMAWQRAADYRWELVGGYAEPPPPEYELPVIQQLSRQNAFSPASAGELRSFLSNQGATVVVVDAADPGPGREVLDALGVRPQEIGGVLVARLRP